MKPHHLSWDFFQEAKQVLPLRFQSEEQYEITSAAVDAAYMQAGPERTEFASEVKIRFSPHSNFSRKAKYLRFI